MLKNLYTKLTGDPNEKEIKRLTPLVEQANALEPEFQQLSAADLRAKTDEFRSRLNEVLTTPRQTLAQAQEQVNTAVDAEDRRMLDEQLKQAKKDLVQAERDILDEILPEAFAAVREASVRTIGLRHFDVQLIGGMVLHSGKVAEMKTGEGKTLVATLPLYLNALLGQGAHLVTVNDYLARRDAQWMGPIYHALGLTVGILQQGEKNGLMFDPAFRTATPELDYLRTCSRQEAYAADITYGTNNEFGFDYLRDNMAWRLEDRVQRALHYAIVDEVDNILIDEARTPLIISGPAGEASDEYYRLADLVRRLVPDDYTIDQRTRSITLTEGGYDRIEQLLGTPLYDVDHPEEVDPQQSKMMHHLEAAMKAQYLFQRDKDYIVRKGQVIIVDEFTGRLMAGRRWSDGLHQAVEAKEHVPIQQESITYATVTLQNYFRLYQRIAGMTGTAKTEEDEFQKVYGLDVIVIPTHKKMIRADHPDQVFRNEEAKWRAVTTEIIGLYARGQPTLIGTTSVELSERLSQRFTALRLQLLSRAHLLAFAIEEDKDLNDKQRSTLKAMLSRNLNDASEQYEEALASRLFHEYSLKAVGDLSQHLHLPARELARLRTRLGARGKETSNAAKQNNLSEKDIRELQALGEKDLKFAAHWEDRQLKLDTAETLAEEIAAHPDDLAKIAERFNLPLETVSDVYQELRLTRSELTDINRALIDSEGRIDEVNQEYHVRSSDLDVIVKRLPLREEDVNRLSKKLGLKSDPFETDSQTLLGEWYGVEARDRLEQILREGIPHSVLNAKEHEKEAGIIARAGEPHSITLATNMAGRGVDIKLGGELPEGTLAEVGRVLHRAGVDPYNLTFDQISEALAKIPPADYFLYAEHVERFHKYMRDRARVRELGGLRIVGTERHEARRIDNQLRGRSGRQGDSGSSRFYVSLEDEIMRRMGGKGLVDRVWVDDIPIEHSWVTRAIEQAQIKMESYNFDIRKHLLEYDDVLNKQREIIYGQRARILTKADLREDLGGWLEEEIARLVAEDLQPSETGHAESRLFMHLDALLPGFFLNENEIWPPFSLDLVQRELNLTQGGSIEAAARAILETARRAMELHRDYAVQVFVPEAVNQSEQQYKTGWNETEDLAKNTLATTRQEAAEQNRPADGRSLALAVTQALGLAFTPAVERGEEPTDRDILEAVRHAFDARIIDQTVRRVEKRIGIELGFTWPGEKELEFEDLRQALVAAVTEGYNQRADRHLADIQRELGERIKSADDLQGTRLSSVLFGISHARHSAFDQRTHRRYDLWMPRFPWVHLAADKVKGIDQAALREEVLNYWTKSLGQLEIVRGGTAPFNDLLRELMLSIVTNLWVDYLTDIEALREGIGLQAYGQRDPLVEYKRRAYEMFQDLYKRIRSQVVTNVFTYQYRGLARLVDEARDRASREAVQAPRATPASPAAAPPVKVAPVERSAKPAAPTRVPVSAATGNKLGRNDPCWCGSGRKYKNCHMSSDMGQKAPARAGSPGKSRR